MVFRKKNSNQSWKVGRAPGNLELLKGMLSNILYYTILYYTILYCTILTVQLPYYTVLYYTILIYNYILECTT